VFGIARSWRTPVHHPHRTNRRSVDGNVRTDVPEVPAWRLATLDLVH
jgi:hypothetical protein